MNKNLKFTGISKITGGEYDDCTINGIFTILGDVILKNLYTNGTIKTNGNVFVHHEINLNGNAKFHGDLKGRNIHIFGKLTVDNNLDGENINLTGIIRVGNRINCDYLNIQSNKLIISKVYANKVVIERPKMCLNPKINIDLIEAAYIDISDTNVQTIKGNEVIVGKNCHIKKLEYTKSLKVDPSSYVDEAIKQSE